MENPFKKAKNFINAAALSGAMISGSESIAQTNGDWIVASPAEVNRRHISESDIQTIDLKNNEEYEVDNSKLAIRFIDKGGHQVHYWINKNPRKNELVIQTLNSAGDVVKSDTLRWSKDIRIEDDIETSLEPESGSEGISTKEMEEKEEAEILQDTELLKSLEDFNVRFRVSDPWAIDPTKDNQRYKIDILSFYKNPPKEIQELLGSEIVEDIENGKKVLIRGGFNDISSMLTFLNIYGSSRSKKALIEFIRRSKKMGGLSLLKTKQEKIDYIKDLLGNKIKESIERLPEYEPPVIVEPERMTDEDFEKRRIEYDVKKNNNLNSRETIKEKDINITEKDIEDALEGE